MTHLTNDEKKALCLDLAAHLPKLRELLNVTQKEFGELCGISTPRVSVIENGHFVMTWSQFTSMIAIFFCNVSTKEYLLANGVLTRRLLQYFQLKDENIPPIVNVNVSDDIIQIFRNNADYVHDRQIGDRNA